MRRLQQQQALHNKYLQRQIARLEAQGRSQSLEIEHLLAMLLPMTTQELLRRLEADLTQLQAQKNQQTTEPK